MRAKTKKLSGYTIMLPIGQNDKSKGIFFGLDMENKTWVERVEEYMENL